MYIIIIIFNVNTLAQKHHLLVAIFLADLLEVVVSL
jgi:hypothetical protein